MSSKIIYIYLLKNYACRHIILNATHVSYIFFHYTFQNREVELLDFFKLITTIF